MSNRIILESDKLSKWRCRQISTCGLICALARSYVDANQNPFHIISKIFDKLINDCFDSMKILGTVKFNYFVFI